MFSCRILINAIKSSLNITSFDCKCYGSFTHRRPLRVIYNSSNKTREGNLPIPVLDYNVTELETGNESTICSSNLNKQIYQKNEGHVQIQSDLKYTKLGDKDSKFNTVITLAKSRKQREKSRKIVLEGRRLILDALEAGAVPEMIFFSDTASLEGFPVLNDVPLYKIQFKKLQLWSDLTSCPGITGIFHTPNVVDTKVDSNILPLTVVCDSVREPGNLGAILRVLAGVGCQRILLTKGCVDLWEPKVLRSACGAHFRIPILKDIEWDYIPNYISEDSSIFLADSTKVFSEATHEKKVSSVQMDECGSGRDGTFATINSHTYSDFDFSTHNTLTLVVGSEAHGLSQSAYKLANSRSGHRLVIPLEKNVESLNAAVALGIIVFEMRRHFSGNANILHSVANSM